MAADLGEHGHLPVHEQVVEGEDELAGAFEHFGALPDHEVVRRRVLILLFLLPRQFLDLFGNELQQEYHKSVDLDLMD